MLVPSNRDHLLQDLGHKTLHPACAAAHFLSGTGALNKIDRIEARAINHDQSEMPPSGAAAGPLTDIEKKTLEFWIATGGRYEVE